MVRKVGKKCGCKGNETKYVVAVKDWKKETEADYIDCSPMTKEEAEDEIAEMLLDYDDEDLLVYKLEKVDFEATSQDVEVEILD